MTLNELQTIMSWKGNLSIKGRLQQTIKDRGDLIARLLPSLSSPKPQGQYQPHSKIMSIPLDIILCVFDLLEAHDAIALSLACKGLYCHLFGDARTRFKNTNNDGRLKVQTMLEKDLPHNHVYCAFCETFHPVDKRYRKRYCQEYRFPNLNFFSTHMPGSQIQRLNYLDARSIMNATLFQRPGAKKKMQWSFHKTHYHWPKDTSMRVWEQSWVPKVIDDELFLKVAASHKAPSAIDNKNEEFTYGVCKHLAIHAQFPHIWADSLSLSRLCFNRNGDLTSGTCSTCAADFTVRIRWLFDKAARTFPGWDVLIVSWHRLGSLRSPHDPVWARCAGGYVTAETRQVEGSGFAWGDLPSSLPEEFRTSSGDRDDRVWHHITYHGGWNRQFEGLRTRPRVSHYGTVRRAWREAIQAGC